MNQEIIACHNMTYDRMAKIRSRKDQGIILLCIIPIHWVIEWKIVNVTEKQTYIGCLPDESHFKLRTQKRKNGSCLGWLTWLQSSYMYQQQMLGAKRYDKFVGFVWFCRVLSFSSVISFWDLWSVFFLMRALWAEGCLLRSAVHQRWP